MSSGYNSFPPWRLHGVEVQLYFTFYLNTLVRFWGDLIILYFRSTWHLDQDSSPVIILRTLVHNVGQGE
jgi:hypothetical protein